MRIVVFGQKWLAVEVLRELLALPRVLVAGVCPDRKGDRLEKPCMAVFQPSGT